MWKKEADEAMSEQCGMRRPNWPLLSLKMEEAEESRSMASNSWKRVLTESPLEPPERNNLVYTLMLPRKIHFIHLTSRTVR